MCGHGLPARDHGPHELILFDLGVEGDGHHMQAQQNEEHIGQLVMPAGQLPREFFHHLRCEWSSKGDVVVAEQAGARLDAQHGQQRQHRQRSQEEQR